jgi:hypothetical protein
MHFYQVSFLDIVSVSSTSAAQFRTKRSESVQSLRPKTSETDGDDYDQSNGDEEENTEGDDDDSGPSTAPSRDGEEVDPEPTTAPNTDISEIPSLFPSLAPVEVTEAPVEDKTIEPSIAPALTPSMASLKPSESPVKDKAVESTFPTVVPALVPPSTSPSTAPTQHETASSLSALPTSSPSEYTPEEFSEPTPPTPLPTAKVVSPDPPSLAPFVIDIPTDTPVSPPASSAPTRKKRTKKPLPPTDSSPTEENKDDTKSGSEATPVPVVATYVPSVEPITTPSPTTTAELPTAAPSAAPGDNDGGKDTGGNGSVDDVTGNDTDSSLSSYGIGGMVILGVVCGFYLAQRYCGNSILGTTSNGTGGGSGGSGPARASYSELPQNEIDFPSSLNEDNQIGDIEMANRDNDEEGDWDEWDTKPRPTQKPDPVRNSASTSHASYADITKSSASATIPSGLSLPKKMRDSNDSYDKKRSKADNQVRVAVKLPSSSPSKISPSTGWGDDNFSASDEPEKDDLPTIHLKEEKQSRPSNDITSMSFTSGNAKTSITNLTAAKPKPIARPPAPKSDDLFAVRFLFLFCFLNLTFCLPFF